MQFVFLVFQGSTPLPNTPEWDALPDTDKQAIYDGYAAFNAAPGVTAGLPLGLAGDARTVTVADGAIRADDGPYLVDADKAAGGYSLVEADTMDAAIELAALVPAARYGGAVEIRPVAVYW